MTVAKESCCKCGRTWGTLFEPRENVVCEECLRVPKLPDGEVRRSPDGLTAVCLGGDDYNRWKLVGHDPDHIVHYGWRHDKQVADWEILGNVYDLKGVAK